MEISRESVRLSCCGNDLAGLLVVPESEEPPPVLIVCHGAGEFKENYLELCDYLAHQNVATLALDMYGHGQSAGVRYVVAMRYWTANIRTAIDFLVEHPRVDGSRIGAFGLSSGGTAVLETALVEPRLKVLVVLEGTVRNSLPLLTTSVLKLLMAAGRIKKLLTQSDLRVPLARITSGIKMAADPDVDRRLREDAHLRRAFSAWPFPASADAFFVNTLARVGGISAPTLVLWGAEDSFDPPETGHLLYQALTCPKQLHVIPGNGHAGHLDRNREQVFALTARWVEQHLPLAVGRG